MQMHTYSLVKSCFKSKKEGLFSHVFHRKLLLRQAMEVTVIYVSSSAELKKRGKSLSKRSTGVTFVVPKMGGINGTSAMSNARTENMIFKSILEKVIFHFDSSADDENVAFLSFSLVPTFECVMGQLIVNIEFPTGTSFFGTGELRGQLERTGKREVISQAFLRGERRRYISTYTMSA